MAKNRKLGIIIAIITTMSEVCVLSALLFSIREMNHEGLTYSQWYEGSIYGFYSCLLVTIVTTSLFLASWISLFRGGKAKNVSKAAAWTQALKTVSIAFAILTAAFVILAAVRYNAIETAAKENVECLEPYIRSYGNSLVYALLSFEAGLASVFGWRKAAKISIVHHMG